MLVASVRPAERFSDLSPAEVSDLFLSAQRVSGGVAKHFGGAAAVTVAMQDGADAGQTVKVRQSNRERRGSQRTQCATRARDVACKLA